LRLLFLGDIFGKPGREAVKNKLQSIVQEQEIDMVVANGENAAGGLGITPSICDNLLSMGIDVITSGNHIYKKKEIYEYLKKEARLIKPANYPPSTPGHGYYISSGAHAGSKSVAVVNLCGRVFIDNLDCPFRTMENILAKLRKETNIIIVDFHAEVTSEKVAMGWFLDGKVSAVIGTHTHVQTADERILPQGTAYITDAGMVGPRDSVIGVKKEIIIERFLTAMPHRFEVSTLDVWINGVIVDIDNATGHADSITRLNISAE